MKVKIAIIAIVTVVLAGCTIASNSGNTVLESKRNNPDKKVVVTSFYPIAHFTEKIAGDTVQVINISEGKEPHAFDLSPSQIAEIENADLFLYNGYTLDTWAEKIAEELDIPSSNIASSILGEVKAHEDEEDDHEEKEDEHGHMHEEDPHLWLNPQLAIEYIEQIELELSKIDGKNSEIFSANAKAYTEELISLDGYIKDKLSVCKSRDVIVQHDAFSYFSERYSLNILSISGISPSQEPTAAALADLTATIKERNIRYIFFEETINPQLAKTLADETGAQVESISTLETLTSQQISSGDDYISLMRKNAEKFSKALNCT